MSNVESIIAEINYENNEEIFTCRNLIKFESTKCLTRFLN